MTVNDLDQATKGLTTAEATKRLATDGPNALPQAKPPGFVVLFIRQFKSPFIYVLLIAAIVSFALEHTINGFFILAVLLLNAGIGSVQEYSAEKAAQALNAMVPHMANVYRDGHRQSIDSTQIVVGDLVVLASGDRVPADGICLETNQLTLDESLLTGESLEVIKQLPRSAANADLKADQSPIRCYAGTVVVRGRGVIQITHTGQNTQIGVIAKAVIQERKIRPPLLQRIEKFTKLITVTILLIIGLIFIISLVRGDELSQVFFMGVALAVSAIPEGLPAAITIALAIGMRRMANKHVVVRSLVAVESLGSCTYIASDKTGTLTVNDMTIEKAYLANGEQFDIREQSVVIADQAPTSQPLSAELMHLAEIGALCNESELFLKDGRWQTHGDQVDIAFLNFYNKLNQSHQQLLSHYQPVKLLPYESENAFSAALNRDNQAYRLSVKGSAEKITAMCKLTDEQIKQIYSQVNELAQQGYRVLALASKKLSLQPETIESGLNQLDYIGLVGIIDPLRSEAAASVELCRQANIDVAMITGDHPETAKAIAAKLGILGEKESIVLGEQLSRSAVENPEEKSRLISQNHVFARVKPLEKKIIVEELQRQGHFVAVTGDGVNDAPALRAAHVGIAMGKRGTDVARESSDLILTDDNFSSIVNGVEVGRVVYANIRKVVFLLISTGAAEILLFILSLIAAIPLPLFPVQLLWLNLVTNGVQDVALAFEPAEGNELKKPPRRPTEPIFNRLMIERVIVNALFMGIIAFGLFFTSLEAGLAETEARNLTLLLMVLFENVHALNSRSETKSVFQMPLLSNPFLLFGILIAQSIHIGAMYTDWLAPILEIQPVTLNQWAELFGIALILLLVNEVHKWWHRKTKSS